MVSEHHGHCTCHLFRQPVVHQVPFSCGRQQAACLQRTQEACLLSVLLLLLVRGAAHHQQTRLQLRTGGLAGDIFAILWLWMTSRLPLDQCKFCLALVAPLLLEGMDSRNTTLKRVILLKWRQHTTHTPMELLQTQASCSFRSFESIPHPVTYPVGCQAYLLPGVFVQARHQLKMVAGSTTQSFTHQNVESWFTV